MPHTGNHGKQKKKKKKKSGKKERKKEKVSYESTKHVYVNDGRKFVKDVHTYV